MMSAQISKTARSRVVNLLAILLTTVTVALGQESGQYDKSTPPQHAAGVSPLGSYTSADLGTINLTNGALNIKLPLTSVGGRGFSVPLTLNYSSKVWSANRNSDFADETGYHPVAYAKYADIENLVDIYSRVAPGWTIGASPTLTMRANGIKDNTTTTCTGDFRYAITKLTVILPDKGEIQFRDDYTDGAPLATQLDQYQCAVLDGNRGRRWHATDGSGAIFVSDTDNGIVRGDLNGVLILSDGTRYRFGSLYTPPPGSPPLALIDAVKGLARGTSITDRNGNVITISYPAANEVRYTDQLGRITKIQKGVPDPEPPFANLAVLVTVPGYQGQNRYFKIKSVAMNQRYRSGINPNLPVINGDYDPFGWIPPYWGTATRLFSQSHELGAEQIDTNLVLSEFALPDGRAIEFFYNEFGEVAEVRLHTGGKLQYDYQYVSQLPAGKSHIGEVMTSYFDSDVSEIERAVVARRTYADGATLEGSWAYTYTNSTTQVTAASASGAVLLNQKHYFLASGRYLNTPCCPPGPPADKGVEGTGYSLWSTGVERRTETLNAAGTAVIAASEQDWTQRTPLVWSAYTTYAQEQPENDNRVNEERNILETGQTARTTTLYDLFNNPTETSEFDFDNTLKRRTVTSYSSTNLVNGVNYADDSIHLLRLPLQQSIYDGAGVEQARATTEYDIYTADGNHEPMLAYGFVSGHDTANYGVSRTARGNATRIGSWIKTSNTFLFSYPRYDMLGNVVSAKDARGNVSTISFADDFGDGSNPGSGANNPATPTYALPTLITSPDPGNGFGSHTARSQYDFSTGLLTGFKDRNNVITQTFYNDAFNRPTLIKSALGVTGIETHAAMFYAPATAFGITLAKNDVLTARDQNALDDAALRSWTVTDGFGRMTEAWSRDPQGNVKVVSVYDALSRARQTSNPFRPSLGETTVFTTTAYDLAGRVTSVTTPDNSVVTTSYTGNTVTVTDQIGKQRKSVTDALGRLKEVYEDPTGLNYLTSYAYDVLDNLTTVTQGTQTRSFVYNSLKRLTSATNPESGTISYQYDNNGNLTQKTDARSIVATYVYDALNRNTTVNYSDTATNPDITRVYDSATNGKGRLRESYAGGTETVGTTVEHMKIQSYDALGRPLDQRQRFKTSSVWSAEYQVQRGYNRASSVTSQTYPSGRPVSYAYDNAGRTNSYSGNLGDGTNRTYSTGIIYSPLGGMAKEQFGTDTPIYNKSFYNSRGQLSEIRVGTTYTGPTDGGWERGAIINHYSGQCWGACNGTDNNGNLKQQDHWIPDSSGGVQGLFVQNYDYDNLNRLQRVHEGTNWQQEYVYDRWGNRTIHQTNTWGLGINKKDFTVNTANNRLGVPGGQSGTMTYDNAGNLTTDTYTGAGSRTYDAENRMTQAWGGLNQQQFYTYNADGQRVRRKVDGVETRQVYGMDGELLAEYAANAAPASPQKEYGYRNGQLLITAEPRTNFALTSNGGVATASSTLPPGFGGPGTSWPASGTNNGDRKGLNWAFGGGWADSTSGAFPDWLQIDFNGSKTIDEIDVFTLQDNTGSPSEPTETMTFSTYGLTAYDVQYWNGSAWVTASGGNITGNNKVWRKITFSPVTTSKIRVLANAAIDNGYSRITEVEAWGAWTGAGSLSANINWLVADQLGTPRMIFDKTGSLASTKRHDYLPFGEELFAGVGGRTTVLGYSSDTIRQKFTSKERDIETGLDYFLARYYSNMQGRFTSIDAAGPDPTDPQTFNKYQYSLNNPLRFVDPDGRQAQEISKLTQSLRDYFAALVRRFQDQVNPEQAQQEGRRPGPFGNGDAALENYNRILGERVEFATDLIMLMDVTGAGTATRGFMRGNRTEMAIGMAGMVAMPLNEVFGVGRSALMSGRLLGGRIGTAEVGAQFSKNGDTLVAGIVGVFNKEGGAGLGSTTRALVDSIVSYAKDQGLSRIEVQAIAVVNPKLEKLLIKQGFQKTTVVVEGEKVAAYTKTFIVQ